MNGYHQWHNLHKNTVPLEKKIVSSARKFGAAGCHLSREGPTPWVSPLVVIPKKNGKIRLCDDMREAKRLYTKNTTQSQW